MAKITSNIVCLGTGGGVTCYRRNGKYYRRKVSSLNAERVKTDPAFAGFRTSSNRMADASKIGASVYNILPPELKQHGLYRTITGAAFVLLKQGVEREKIIQTLQAQYIDPLLQKPVKKRVVLTLEDFPDGRSPFSGKRLFYTPSGGRTRQKHRYRRSRCHHPMPASSACFDEEPFPSAGSDKKSAPALADPTYAKQEAVAFAGYSATRSSKLPSDLAYLGRLPGFRKIRIYEQQIKGQFLIGFKSCFIKYLPEKLRQQMIEQ